MNGIPGRVKVIYEKDYEKNGFWVEFDFGMLSLKCLLDILRKVSLSWIYRSGWKGSGCEEGAR